MMTKSDTEFENYVGFDVDSTQDDSLVESCGKALGPRHDGSFEVDNTLNGVEEFVGKVCRRLVRGSCLINEEDLYEGKVIKKYKVAPLSDSEFVERKVEDVAVCETVCGDDLTSTFLVDDGEISIDDPNRLDGVDHSDPVTVESIPNKNHLNEIMNAEHRNPREYFTTLDTTRNQEHFKPLVEVVNASPASVISSGNGNTTALVIPNIQPGENDSGAKITITEDRTRVNGYNITRGIFTVF